MFSCDFILFFTAKQTTSTRTSCIPWTQRKKATVFKNIAWFSPTKTVLMAEPSIWKQLTSCLPFLKVIGTAPEKLMVGKLNIPEKGPCKFSVANLLLVLGCFREGKWNNARSLKKNLQQMFENENGSSTVCTHVHHPTNKDRLQQKVWWKTVYFTNLQDPKKALWGW